MEVPTPRAKADVLADDEPKEGRATERGAEIGQRKELVRFCPSEPGFAGRIRPLGVRPPGERTSPESGGEFSPDACEPRRVAANR
jgi:hypothetical protein